MKLARTTVIAAVVCFLLILPVITLACQGTARLIGVTPAAGGCVSGPTGTCSQAWDVEPGHVYTITLSNVTQCANGGTDPTLNVRVNSSSVGNTDLVAVYVSPGVYRFNYMMSAGAVCTMSIYYCTTPGVCSSGLLVIRNDGAYKDAYLRASRFEGVGTGCANPVQIIGKNCSTVGVDESCWGAIKEIFR